MNRIFIIFLLLLAGSLPILAKTGRYRAMWRTDPASTMVLGWEQISGKAPKVYFQEAANPNSLWFEHPSDRQVEVRQMQTNFARLSGLKPDTRYRFFIRDSEMDSPIMAFHTAPAAATTPITLIAGGDSRNNRLARQQINALAARMQPLAILFSGDMTDWASVTEWQEWLDDWQLTITRDGRLIPIIVARGNHEPSNDLLLDLFDLPHPDLYYALGFGGDLLRVYTLNSMAPVYGKQQKWLRDDLESHGADYTWRIAQYHHPIRPHQRRKKEQLAQWDAWAGLFYEHNVQLVQECDAHVFKVTWPIRPASGPGSDEGFIRDDKQGTIYIGEGGWGAPLRKADDAKPWTRSYGSFHQFNWMRISDRGIDIRVIKSESFRFAKSLPSLSYGELPQGLSFHDIQHQEKLVLRAEDSPTICEALLEPDHFPMVSLNGRNHLQVPYKLANPAEIEIRFINLRKQIIHTESHHKSAGNFMQSVPVQHLPPGKYVLQVLANGQSIMQRLVLK